MARVISETEGSVNDFPSRVLCMAQAADLIPGPSVVLGPYQIQGKRVVGPGLAHEHTFADIIRLLQTVGDVHIQFFRSGTWVGPGHGTATCRISLSGTCVLSIRYVPRCVGPGCRCSYDHGPFFEF